MRTFTCAYIAVGYAICIVACRNASRVHIVNQWRAHTPHVLSEIHTNTPHTDNVPTGPNIQYIKSEREGNRERERVRVKFGVCSCRFPQLLVFMFSLWLRLLGSLLLLRVSTVPLLYLWGVNIDNIYVERNREKGRYKDRERVRESERGGNVCLWAKKEFYFCEIYINLIWMIRNLIIAVLILIITGLN